MNETKEWRVCSNSVIRSPATQWTILYALSSSTLLVVNKLAVDATKLPSLVSGAQLFTSASVVVVMQICGMPVLGAWEKSKVVPFIIYTSIFACCLFANMKALLHTNVGAVIGVRSALPLLVCSLEFHFMGKPLPGFRGSVSLMGVVFSAFLYIFLDSGFHVSGAEGYVWLLAWWTLLGVSNTYGKYLTEKVDMTQWERVFYTNALALPPTLAAFLLSSESHMPMNFSHTSVVTLSISCVLGIAISYSGWKCRSEVTATTFTLIGVVSKIGTIALSVIIWPQENLVGKTACLFSCIAFGLAYQEQSSNGSVTENYMRTLFVSQPRKAVVVTMISVVSIFCFVTATSREPVVKHLLTQEEIGCDVTQAAGADGFGSQYQNIVQTMIFAMWHNLSFCVQPISRMDHNYDGRAQFLEEVNNLLHLPANKGETEALENKKRWFDSWIINKQNAEFAQKHLHELGKDFLEYGVYDYAVVHIRRKNRNDNRETFLDFKVHCHAMRLVQAKHPSIKFIVHSQGNENDFKLFQDPRITLRLNEPLNATFPEMVNAKVLIMATSSFSYAAALINNGEVWAPEPWWHAYPFYWNTFNSSICIPQDEPCLGSHTSFQYCPRGF